MAVVPVRRQVSRTTKPLSAALSDRRSKVSVATSPATRKSSSESPPAWSARSSRGFWSYQSGVGSAGSAV